MKHLLPILPIILGFLLDCVIGDPYNIPHPIRYIGRLISTLENIVRKRMKNLRLGGALLALTVVIISTAVPLAVLLVCYRVPLILGVAVEAILCCYMLAAKCLCNESMKVCHTAEKGDTEAARKAVSMIVGRDTEVLDRDGIIRAAVETVAENTSDGVTAPLFYMGIGGAVGAFFYKSVNTMDSMIGYKDEKYADIGRFAAKLDDVLNFIPSRIGGVLMVLSAGIASLAERNSEKHYSLKNAWKIFLRDRKKHSSPNSAQTEAACAGALMVALSGDNYYFGKLVKKPQIGDAVRPLEAEDIKRSHVLLYISAFLMVAAVLGLRVAFFLMT